MGNLFSCGSGYDSDDSSKSATAIPSEPRTTVIENPHLTIEERKEAFRISLGSAFVGYVDQKPATFVKTRSSKVSGEINLRLLDHPNVVRPLFTVQHDNSSYLVFEHLSVPLSEVIPYLDDYKEVVTQLADGVEYLHDSCIANFSLDPKDLCTVVGNPEKLVVKFIDFRSAIRTNGDGYSDNMFNDMAKLGSLILNIFSEGSVTNDLQINSVENILLERTESPTYTDILCADLIHKLKLYKQQERLKADEIKGHPFFWDENKIVAFIFEVNKRIEKEYRYGEDNFFKRLDAISTKVLGSNDWSNVDSDVLNELKKAKKDYHERKDEPGPNLNLVSNLKSLLQTMRNTAVHYQQSERITNLMGSNELFVDYWLGKFPHLLQRVYNVVIDDEEGKPLPKKVRIRCAFKTNSQLTKRRSKSTFHYHQAKTGPFNRGRSAKWKRRQ